MNMKNMTIEFSSSLSNVVEVNPSFDSAKLRIAYTGKNRNNSFISKEAFERAIPTMYNCPVVANYIRESDEIGSHDGEFVKDSNGNTKYVNITQPVGMIPESAQYSWEIVEDNGVIHQYLCTDVILWKRQEAYQKIKDNGITEQSMEIAVTDGEMLDDYYNIKDFCFTAFCLLGTAEPCFESAALFTFSTEDFKQQYTEMMKEFKAAFCTANITQKEGRENLRLKELLKKYKVSEADLTFDYKGLSDEELEAKFAEVYEAKKKNTSEDEPETEPDDDVEEPESESQEQDNQEDEPEAQSDNDDTDDTGDNDSGDSGDADFALNSERQKSLYEAVSAEKIDTDWGSYSRRWMVDYDPDLQEVYYYDYEDDKLYGCPFEFNGDDAVVDFKKCKRKKYAIVDYIEGEEQNFTVRELIESFNEAYTATTRHVSENKTELERLKAFEQEILKEKRDADETALFEKFDEQLHTSDEFKALKANSKDYSLEQLEKELFVLVGKMNFTVSEKKERKPIAPTVMSKDESDSEFGGLFAWKKTEKTED